MYVIQVKEAPGEEGKAIAPSVFLISSLEAAQASTVKDWLEYCG